MDLIGDSHLPTSLDELKKSIELITTAYGHIDRKVQVLEQTTSHNTSLAVSGSSQSQPYIGQSFQKFKGPNNPSLFHVQPNWTFQNLMVMIPLPGYIKSSNISP